MLSLKESDFIATLWNKPAIASLPFLLKINISNFAVLYIFSLQFTVIRIVKTVQSQTDSETCIQ
jgi:hypothetical protein